MPSTEDSSAFSRPFSRPRPNCSPRPPCCPISPKGICSCPRWRTISCRAACWLPSSFSPPARKRAFSGSSKRGWGSPRRGSPTGLTPSTSPFPHSPPCSISSGSSTPPFSTPRPPCVFSAPFSSFPDSSASRAPGASGGAPISPCPSFSSPLPDFSFCLRGRRIFPICSPFSARRFRRPRRDLRRLWGIFRTPHFSFPFWTPIAIKRETERKSPSPSRAAERSSSFFSPCFTACSVPLPPGRNSPLQRPLSTSPGLPSSAGSICCSSI